MLKLEDFDLDIIIEISKRLGGNDILNGKINKVTISDFTAANSSESNINDRFYYTALKLDPTGIEWRWTYQFSLSDYKQKFREKNLNKLI